MSRGLIAILVGIVGVASVFGGCGGDDDSSTALTKQAFIKQGDAICVKANAQKDKDLKAAFAKQSKAGSPVDKAFEENLVTTVALPPIAQMSEELAALGAPSEEAEAVVTAFEDGVENVEDNPASVLDGSNPFEEADTLAGKYGFKACSQI